MNPGGVYVYLYRGVITATKKMARFLPLTTPPTKKTHVDNMSMRWTKTWEAKGEDAGFVMNTYGQLAPQDIFVCLRNVLIRLKSNRARVICYGTDRLETLINISNAFSDVRNFDGTWDVSGLIEASYTLIDSMSFDFTSTMAEKIYHDEWQRTIDREPHSKSLISLHAQDDFVSGQKYPMNHMCRNHLDEDRIAVKVMGNGKIHCHVVGTILPEDVWVFLALEILFGGTTARLTWGEKELMCSLADMSSQYKNILVYQHLSALYTIFESNTMFTNTGMNMKDYIYTYSRKMGSPRGWPHLFINEEQLVKTMNTLAPVVNVRRS